MLDRRLFLGGIATLPFLPKTVHAMKIGDGELITISDGSLSLPMSLPTGVPADELATIAERFGLAEGAAAARPLNVSLWRRDDRLVLIDAGSGTQFVPTAGELLNNLEAAGVGLDDVTDVIFTHGHPDHLWGILDDFDEIAFPEATLHFGQTEADFWLDPATVESMPEARQTFAVGAARRLETISDSIQPFHDGDEILPGITALSTPGHTLGHTSFVVESKGEKVMILGDAVVNAHLNFARPGWPSDSDQDPDLAARTRLDLLDDLATTGMLTVGYHLPGDGIGRVEGDGDGYRFIPEAS